MFTDQIHTVLEALNYEGKDGLVTTHAAPDMSSPKGFIWREAVEKFGIDAAYFRGDAPLVYFHGWESADDKAVGDLHRQLWNHNRAPLLVTTRPEDIRVYSCFEPPARPDTEPDGSGLLRVLDLLATAPNWSALQPFNWNGVESGRFAVT